VRRRAGASRAALGAAAAALAWLAIACLDIASPVSGITSITPVLSPTPSVVEGDSLRDTLGVVQGLQVHAFGPNGDTIPDADLVVRFFAVDPTNKLRVVDSVTGVVVGDALSPNAHVVARITPANGKGLIQTTLLALPVVPVPLLVTRGADVQFNFVPAIDTLSSGLLSPPMSVTVHGIADTTVQSYLVSFEVVDSLPSTNGQPTLVLTSAASTADSTVAVTNSSGIASIRLRLRLSAIDPRLLVGTATDTVVVRVHVRYLGKELTVSPTPDFVIPVHSTR
jgi:hypothetical protein